MKGFLRHLAFICAMMALAAFSALPIAAAETANPQRDGDAMFMVEGTQGNAALEADLRLAGRTALLRIHEASDLELTQPVHLVWSTDKEYHAQTGFRPESTAGAANPRTRTIYINAGVWTRSPQSDKLRTMAHELGHVMLAGLPGGGDLPLWANEGIVMHLAGQWSMDDDLKLLAARAFGPGIRLIDLENTFPRDGDAQTLAYRFSYAAVGSAAQSLGDDAGSVRRLLMLLSDPSSGPALESQFWDGLKVQEWQHSTELALGSRMNSAIIVLTSTGSIFLLITLLFLFASWRRRVQKLRKEQEWEEDEPWRASLTEADVQDIYGDSEDRWQDGD